MRLAFPVSLAVTVMACGGLPDPPEVGGAVEWSIEPPPHGSNAPSVLALHVPRSGSEADIPELLLYEDELSEYYVNRVRQGDLPDTLEERRVGAMTWCNDEECVLRPATPLEAGTYTFAIAGVGVVGSFTVASDPVFPSLRRVWPPVDSPTGSSEAIYCSDAELLESPSSEDLVLWPAGVEGHFEAGGDAQGTLAERCVRLVFSAAPRGATVMPPALLGNYVFDPSPIRIGDAISFSALSCEAPESSFGPGCATVLDDRLIVRGAGGAMLWIVQGTIGIAPELHSVAPSRHMILRGLTPGKPFELDVTARDAAGSLWVAKVSGLAAVARPHVVINEVMANPLGPEPAQEWVELVNDGSSAVDLSRWQIEDSSRATELPGAVLAPGEFALVVSDAYVSDPQVDLTASPATQTLRVAELGKSGLSNSGEIVRLRTPDGEIASRFSALAAASAGVSQARREPWALDDEPGAIAPHAPPGASPGASNVIDGDAADESANIDVYGAGSADSVPP